MIDFHVVAENLKDSLDEHRQKAVVFCAGLVFMAVLGILSFALVKEVKKTAEIKKENELVLDQKLLAPKGPVVPDEYSLSRVTSDKWSSDEIEKWWTVPGDEDVQEISDANDRLVNGIIGAAP